MQQPKQIVMYNSYNTQPNFSYLGGQSGHVSAFYSTVESGEEPDEFLIGSSYYAVRTEQGGDEADYQYGIDDTTAHLLDLGIDEEETINLNQMVMENGVLDQADYPQHMETEEERLRRENRELRSLVETRHYERPHDFVPHGQIEEEIEEEYRTFEPTVARLPLFDVAIQCSGRNSKSTGVGNFSVDRYHLIDLHSDVIDETHFPGHYWSRLEEVFRRRFSNIPPGTRDVSFQSHQLENRTAATMVTPIAPKERLCFGVTVRPMTQDVGVSCVHSTTREFGCTTIETDVMLKDWIDKHLRHLNESQRKIVTQLIKSSSKSRDEFVEHILKYFGKEVKSIGVDCKPEFRSSFSMTVTEEDAGAPVTSQPPLQMESKLVEARPVMVNKPIMTVRMLGIGAATETDPPLLRSQTSQTERKLPEVTGCGVQTVFEEEASDGDATTVRVAHSMTSKSRVRVARSQERPSDSGYEASQSRGYEHQIRRRPSSYDPKHEDRRKSSRHGSAYSHSIQFKASRPMSPEEMRQLFPTYFKHGPLPPEGTEAPTEEATHATADDPTLISDHPDSYTVSSEKRIVDEQSERHLLSTDTDFEQLTHGGSAAIEAVLSRSRPIGTKHVVREFLPTFEVLYHTDDTGTLTELRSPDEFAQRTDHKTGPGDKKTHSIPVVRSKQKSEPTDLFAEHAEFQPVRVIASPTRGYETKSGTDARRIPLNVRVESPSPVGEKVADIDQSTPSGPMLGEDVSSGRYGMSPDQSGRSPTAGADVPSPRRSFGPYRLPLRNNSFTMPKDAIHACEVLKECYLAGKLPSHDPKTKAQLTKLCDIWFEMATMSSSVSIAQLEDFLATLNEYHEDLVRDVLRSTDDQGLTSLHLAVGHGAWPVVNLILDSGYAEPDRLNRAGFSPIMISTFGSTPTPTAMTTLNRLYTLGNVNLHSSAGSGLTPLMLAAQHHAMEIAELLLLHGAAVNTQDRAGNTALMFAIQKGDQDMVGLLLDQPQLDLSLVDNRGEDALTIALHRGNQVIVDLIRNTIKYGCRKSAVFAVPPSDSRSCRRRRIREILERTRTSRVHTSLRPNRSSAKQN